MEIINTLLAADVDPNPQLNMHRPSRGGNSGRFGDNQLSTGCTPLFRAAQSNDVEVMRALLARGASPNINAMGFTPFLLVAGVSPGGRGGGGGAPNTAMMDLMIEHGADVNAQVAGTRTYSMRISYHPPSGQRRHVGSPRSSAGGTGGPGSLPAGQRSQSRACRRQRPQGNRFGWCWRPLRLLLRHFRWPERLLPPEPEVAMRRARAEIRALLLKAPSHK